MYIGDEFEVEHNTQYSGSYSDRIVSGTLDNSGNKRYLAASKVGNVNWFSIVNANNYTVYSSEYYVYKDLGYNGYDYRFLSVNDPDEVPQDCYVPHYADIININGAKIVSSSIDVNGYNLYSTQSFKIILSDKNVMDSSNTTQIADTNWLNEFPYQNKYKNAKLLLFNRNPIEIDVNSNTVFREQWDAATPPTEIQYDSINNNSPGRKRITIEFVLSASTENTSTNKNRHITLVDRKSNVNSSGDFVFNNPTATDDTLDPKTFFKCYYGFGDYGEIGSTKYSNWHFLSNSIYFNAGMGGEVSRNFFKYGFAPIIRGWKYGIYNALGANSKAVWRTKKYGQFRDMLEQRMYTKFYGFPSVVEIKFVSGSQAYLTASNPSLNVSGSGIYDFEYKASLPFFDNK